MTTALPPRTQADLLDAVVESIEGQPWLDWRKIGVAMTVAPDSVKDTVALARQYAESGYDATAYFERLGEIDAATGRLLWSIGKLTDDRRDAMRHVLASIVRVLDEEAMLLVVGEALELELLARTPQDGAEH